MTSIRSYTFALLLCLLWAGCDTVETQRVVQGVDLDVLFSPPTATEIQAMLDEWAGRDVSPQDVNVLATETVDLGQGVNGIARVIEHTVAGNKHVGAVIVPEGATGPLPIMVYNHGGDGGENLDLTLTLFRAALPHLAGEYMFVVPSFRDEPLTVAGQDYQSEGPASPWDYDIDDALALLNIAIDTTPAADPDRIAAMGFSRGGGVSLLMGVRDPRIDKVIDYFGPTDFYGPFVQEIVEDALNGMGRNLPGFDYLDATYIQPLKNGAITMENARSQVLRRSPVVFVDRLPDVMIHHGELDTVVPVGQAQSLIDALMGEGRQAPSFQYYLYPTAGHNPLEMPESFDLASDFLLELVEGN